MAIAINLISLLVNQLIVLAKSKSTYKTKPTF